MQQNGQLAPWLMRAATELGLSKISQMQQADEIAALSEMVHELQKQNTELESKLRNLSDVEKPPAGTV